MFLSGLASVLCPLANSYWALVLYVVVLGILDGSYIGLMSIVTLDIVGVHKIAPAWGILFFCQSFTYLLGPPAAGNLCGIITKHFEKERQPGRECLRIGLRDRKGAKLSTKVTKSVERFCSVRDGSSYFFTFLKQNVPWLNARPLAPGFHSFGNSLLTFTAVKREKFAKAKQSTSKLRLLFSQFEV